MLWMAALITYVMQTNTSNKFISMSSPVEEWAVKMLAFALIWFTPLAGKIAIVTVFIVLDTIMGVVAAHKLGEEVSSRKLRQGFVPKAIGYAVMVTGCYFIDNTVYDVHATYLGVMFVSFAEMKSMDENLKKITGFSIWDKVLDFIKKK